MDMDVMKTFCVFLYIVTIIFVHKSDAGIDEDMQALENEMKLDDMKKSQKKSVKDMTTEELIEELKKGLQEEKKSPTEKFHDIIAKSSLDDFEKLLSQSTTKKDDSKTRTDKKSANSQSAMKKSSSAQKKETFHDSANEAPSDTKKEAVKIDETAKKETEESIIKRALATIEELKSANVNDLYAQKKGLDLLDTLIKADENKSTKRSVSIMDKLSEAREAAEKEETAKFQAALDADNAAIKKLKDDQEKEKEKEKEKKKREKVQKKKTQDDTDKTLKRAIDEVVNNAVEVTKTKEALMDDVLNLMASDLVKQIADETAHNTKRDSKLKYVAAKEDAYTRCEDKRDDCKELTQYCTTHRKKLLKICAKSCKFCEPCKDKWSGKDAHKCKLIRAQGMCMHARVENVCRKSCGYCRIPSPPKCSQTKFGCCWDKSTIKLNSKGSNCKKCKDQYKFVCERFKIDCSSLSKPGTFMRSHCPEKCDLCKETCRDDPKKVVLCPFWKKELKWCTKQKEIMRHFCPVTCGVC